MKPTLNSSINKLAIPSIIAGLAEPLISVTDLTLISNALDEVAIASTGLGAYVVMLIVWVLSSIKNVAASLIAKDVGANNLKAAKETLNRTLALSFLVGSLAAILFNLIIEPILIFQDAKGETLRLATEYFRIRSIGIPFMLASLTLFGGFKGFQNTHWAMQIILIGGTINIILDLLLINGNPLIDAFGVNGAAIASTSAQIIMFILAYFRLKKSFSFEIPQRLWDANTRIIFKMSIALMIRSIAMNTVFFLSNKLATSYGNSYMAAHSFLFWLWLLQSYFIDGYANAAMALSGKFKGMNDLSSLKTIASKTCITNVLLALVIGCIMWVSFPTILQYSNKSDLSNIMKAPFLAMLCTFPVGAIAFSFDGIFIGLGKATFLRNLLIFSSIFIFVPIMYYFHTTGYQLLGIWMGMLIWLSVRALVPLVYFWKKIVSEAV